MTSHRSPKITLALLLTLVCGNFAHVGHDHDHDHAHHRKHAKCGFKHDLIKEMGMSEAKQHGPVTDTGKRHLWGSHEFKVHVDTSNVRIQDPALKDYLINHVVNHGNKIFASKIKVNGNQTIEGSQSIVSSCSYQHVVQIPSNYAYNETDGDFLLFLATDNTGNDGSLAYATACYLDRSSGRPLVGFTVFNDYYLKVDNGKSDNDIATYVHETLHALIFSSTLWKFMPKVNGLDQYFIHDGNHYLRSPILVNEARKHFNCPQIQAIPLEDDGGDGSKGGHFERVVFGDETMVSEDVATAKFSRMTLALMKDSGWYDIDLSKGDHYTWGKGEGCAMFNKTCNNSTIEETCDSNNNYGCDKTFKYKMNCQKTTFTNGCNIKAKADTCLRQHNNMYFFESANQNSRCQEFLYKGQKKSGCVEIKCANDRKSYQVGLRNNGDVTLYTCHKENQVFTWGSNFKFYCENPLLICNDLCPKSCNHRGRCLEDGTCWCDPYYSGAVCGTYDGCGNQNSQTCQRIQSANHFTTHNMSNSYSSSDYDSNYLNYASWADLGAGATSTSGTSTNTSTNNNYYSGGTSTNTNYYSGGTSGYSGSTSGTTSITDTIRGFLSVGSFPCTIIFVLTAFLVRF